MWVVAAMQVSCDVLIHSMILFVFFLSFASYPDRLYTSDVVFIYKYLFSKSPHHPHHHPLITFGELGCDSMNH